MSAQQLIDSASCQRALALRDLTDAAYGPHAMQLLLSSVIDALCGAWSCPVIVHRASPLISPAENYDRLHYPMDGASRNARYTRYVTADLLLRTQLTASVPAALRVACHARYEDVLIACPGLAYRRDCIDRLHTGEPHQLDLWRIRRAPLTERHLTEMVRLVAGTLLPGCVLRETATSHPYTHAGREIEVRWNDRWVEIGECGLALPAILAEAGLDPMEYQGLAMGIGLDRLLMLRKGIDDIRLLRSTDPQVASQMQDLAPYRPAPTQPAMRRDLSIAVDARLTPEDLGDRVRAALGERARCVEAVEVISQTPYYALSSRACRRLGIKEGQKNVLLRLVLRDLDRTLTSQEANEVRDVVYGALHEGSVHVWAAQHTPL